MDLVPMDHKSLVLALSWARDRLKALRRQEAAGLGAARHSMEDTLAAILQAEERLWACARVKRERLQGELVAIQEANEGAARAHNARIQTLQHRLGTLHTRLLASPEAALSMEMAQEAADLIARCAHLTLTLTWAHFMPQLGDLALGELQKEDRALSLPPSKKEMRRAREGKGDSPMPKEVGKESQSQPDGTCSACQAMDPPRPLTEAGLVEKSKAQGALPAAKEAEKGVMDEGDPKGALPGPVKSTTSSATEEMPGRCLLVAGSADGAVPPPPPLDPSGSQDSSSCPASDPDTLPLEPGTLFHASPVWVQEDNSDASSGETGASRLCRDMAVLGSRVPSAREPPFPRWASAECLGKLAGGGTRKGGGSHLGGSCMELVERGLDVSLGKTHPGELLLTSVVPPRQEKEWQPETTGPAKWVPAQCPQTLPQCPRTPAPPCDQLVGQWGQWGSQQGQLSLPHGLCVVPTAGTLYVVDFGNRRLQELGGGGQVLPLRGKAYFDVAQAEGGGLALTNTTRHCVELYNPRGHLLQALSEGFQSPRGIASNPRGELLVADTRLGALHVLVVSASQLVRCGTVPGFHKPYLVATNGQGEVAVSERGLDGGCCVKVLGPTWQVLRVLGVRNSPPLLTNPWGVSLDEAGRVLVADWGRHVHSVLCYPRQGRGWKVVTKGLSSPRGVALLGDHHLVVADSMHHCLKTFQYC